MSIEGLEKDLKGTLCKIWNRMSSGTCFPPPVQAVETPKAPLDEAERGFGLFTNKQDNCQKVVLKP